MPALIVSPIVDIAFVLPPSLDRRIEEAPTIAGGFRLYVAELIRLQAFEHVVGYLVHTMGGLGSGALVCDLMRGDSLTRRIQELGIPRTPELCEAIHSDFGVWLDGRAQQEGEPYLGAFRVQWHHGLRDGLVGEGWDTDSNLDNVANYGGGSLSIVYRCRELEVWSADHVRLNTKAAQQVMREFRTAFEPVHKCDGGLVFAGTTSVIPVGDRARV